MSADTTTPVRDLEGIGPSIEARLQAIGVFGVFDLLRTTAGQIHPAVASTSSIEQVAGWQSMARFLQLDEMTPQWAEALVRGGIETLEELHGASLDRLEAIFQGAQQGSIISTEPSAQQIAAMIRSVAVVLHTGSLDGTVLDEAGTAIEGVQVRLGFRSAVSDTRGRFRLWGLPLGRGAPLVLEHPNHRTHIEVSPLLSMNPELVSVQLFTLGAVVAGDEPAVLDEYDGQVLPRMTGMPVRSVLRELADLREGDVFVVHSLYKRTPDAMLASRFLAYSNGEFRVHRWTVPLSMLPAELNAKEHVRLGGGVFRRTEMNIPRLEILKAMARVRNAVPRPSTTPTPADLMELIEARKQALKSEGVI